MSDTARQPNTALNLAIAGVQLSALTFSYLIVPPAAAMALGGTTSALNFTEVDVAADTAPLFIVGNTPGLFSGVNSGRTPVVAQAMLLAGVSGTTLGLASAINGPVRVSQGLEGGVLSALFVNTPQVIKAAPGILVRVCIQVVGSAGNLTFNDWLTTSGAAAGNQLFTIAFGSLSVGQMLFLEWPCATGIVISSIPTGGSVSVSFS